jgi:lysozyme
MMSANQVATILIHKWEGCKLTAYPDPATGGDPWTIGYGATGPNIHEGTVWTQAQADTDLTNRLTALISKMASYIHVPVTDNQLGAMASLAYNIGFTAWSQSTLLRELNSGDIQSAANQFLMWNRAAGKVMTGLENRRKDERATFLA